MGQTQEIVEELVGNAHGNLARVRELVDAYPELVNARAKWDETPIEAATQMGNRAIIDFLVERGAPVDFFTAIVLGRTEQLRRELAANPARAKDRGVHDLAPLYFAGLTGNVEVADLLLENGAGVNDACAAAAPIHGAVMGDQPAMVRWFLEHSADASLPDYKGRSAFELATELKRTEIASLLK